MRPIRKRAACSSNGLEFGVHAKRTTVAAFRLKWFAYARGSCERGSVEEVDYIRVSEQ